ncbi:hypothetical protein A3J19_04985 [Candidatus Daviesbacteria bacterium RIFCSPLOWO2_02_FULL_41_8]|uniref:Methyltransferase type 11 domain-containing protein n=1 Tax=Candidatus Daviesbacteria bacterium RIFCSPLOWO2_02_FULL_41_8 TaxID=1797798 RepID=A0A1F5NJ36_9BACT|nr:MAG: hypothetical protein A3J19_04985 [Candidatus Daviesbacteria bacterium RIFCSPLOWO2_02_FULL_41_8]
MPKAKNDSLREKCPICPSFGYKVIYPSSVNFGKDLNGRTFSARRFPDRVHGTIVKCNKCGLVRTLEIIDSHQLSALYHNSQFTYNSLIDNLRFSYAKIVQEALRYSKRKNNFLDIGCGNGFMLEEAQKIGFKKVYGIEPSWNAISKAGKSVKSNIKHDILRPGIFNKNSFDVITVFQVFDHIPDPNHFLKICLTLLRPKGVLVLMNHDVESIFARVLGEKSPIIDIEHTYFYSQKTIAKILRKNGYRLLKAYSPSAKISIRYLMRLLPLPNNIKRSIQNSNIKPLDINLTIKLGNICAISTKR